MEKISGFIVKRRWIILLIFIAMIVYCACSIGLVEVERSITNYLPEDTDTKKALDIMEKEFVTYGTTRINVSDVAYDEAEELSARIRKIDGVKEVVFDGSEAHYKDRHALISVTFAYETSDARAVEAYNEVIASLEGYDISIPTSLLPSYELYADSLAKDMKLIIGLAAIVIVVVLIFTSKSFAEVLVFPFVFGIAALLNMGTNYWFGKISFVSNSVCIILQLALAIDYSIILCHRFTAEKERCDDIGEAMVSALSKAIPEILSSCLTTISGLLALVAMQLKLGADLGLVLAKSIAFSILTVIFLMPTLLLLFSKFMDKSKHRSFVPKISFLGKGVVKAGKILPVIFICLIAVFGGLSTKIDYTYVLNNIESGKPTDAQIAIKETEEIFGIDNMLVVLVPVGDYEKERQVLERVGGMKEITSALGIANIEFEEGIYVTDGMTYSEFSNLTGIDAALSRRLFDAYRIMNGIGGSTESMEVPLIDVAIFGVRLIDSGIIGLGEEDRATLEEIKPLIKDADDQLIGDRYSRLVFNLDMPIEGEETFRTIDEIKESVKQLYPDAILAGESINAYDLRASFQFDNLIIGLLTVAFVYAILLFTFKSWGLPLLLVAIIQGAIYINFGLVPLFGKNFFFFIYLIVSAIQMGATIDYAILMTNHYREERATKDKKTAVIDAINASFPTIITSGTIMTVAAFLVGIIASDPLISSLGMCLGRGTIISIISVMTVLPATLYLFEGVIKKTSFGRKRNSSPPPYAVCDVDGGFLEDSRKAFDEE
ncbi:MAG: MMPL family transporter [Clostridia bacterium]|nr:MMPL family transporter [Clostridia bacterium]